MSRERLFEGPARTRSEGELQGYTKKYRMRKHRQQVRGNLRGWVGSIQEWMMDEVRAYHEMHLWAQGDVAPKSISDPSAESKALKTPTVRDHLPPELVRQLQQNFSQRTE